MEALRNLAKPYGHGALRERYGVVVKRCGGDYGRVTEALRNLTEPLWKTSILPILIKIGIVFITKMWAWLKWACHNRK